MAVKNFLNIPDISFKEAQVIIVPFGFETSTTYGRGTKNGPIAIINASSQLELFDEELWQETYKKIKITTWTDLKIPESFAGADKKISAIIDRVLREKKIPIVLGGEHSITSFIAKEFKKFYRNFSILQFDAHADLRDGYLGKKYSHAAAMRRCMDIPGVKIAQVGIRNISNENDELRFWKKNQDRIETFWAKDMKNWKIDKIVNSLSGNVYLTFDVDAFDSSLMPSTGTPEPGGLQWHQTMEILKAVAKNKKIIGADVVELAPIDGFSAPDFLVAKLIYKIIGYEFFAAT